MLVVAAAAVVAAGLVYGLPSDWVGWIPAATGAIWTFGLAWLGRRFGRVDGTGTAPSLRWAIAACGLLTVLLGLLQARGRVGIPELVVLGGVAVSFGGWVVAAARERRQARSPRVSRSRRGGNGRGAA